MPRAAKAVKRPAHRPILEIDWDIVADYLETGCPSTKIADAIGVSVDTLYNRCEQDKGVSFSAFAQQKRAKGDALLYKAQFDKAIGKTNVGDSSLLTHLGKTRLEQRESIAVAVTPEAEKNYQGVMNAIDEFRKSRQTASNEQESSDSSFEQQ